MSTETQTDLRTFEALLDEKWCHFISAPGVSRCGMPISEPRTAPHTHRSDDLTMCDGCGRRKCPDCVAIMRERL